MVLLTGNRLFIFLEFYFHLHRNTHYRGAALQELLWEEADLLLLTKDDVAAPQRFFLSQLRQGVETTFSQLWRELIDRVGARSWHGLWNTMMLKLLHFQWMQSGRLTA